MRSPGAGEGRDERERVPGEGAVRNTLAPLPAFASLTSALSPQERENQNHSVKTHFPHNPGVSIASDGTSLVMPVPLLLQ